MVLALATGQGWLTDETKLNRLLELSVGPNQRNQVEQYVKSWQARPCFIALNNFFGKETFQIAQYAPQSRQMAIEKLSQFPRGTTFLRAGPTEMDGEESAFEEVSKAVAAFGISIVKQ